MNHVLITGGTGLFGSTLVKALIEGGYKVTFTSRTPEKAEKLIKEIGSSKALNYKVANFSDANSVEKFVLDCDGTHFTHLINNARTLDSLEVKNGLTSCDSMQEEFFMAVTLSYLLSMGFKQTLKAIVNISSMYGVVPPNKNLYLDEYENSAIQYGVAKAAQIHLTKELAVRFASLNVRVNAISFGGIEGRVDAEFINRYSSLCPLGRMLSIGEIVGPVMFLLDSDRSSGMTGHNMVVDGGWSTW